MAAPLDDDRLQSHSGPTEDAAMTPRRTHDVDPVRLRAALADVGFTEPGLARALGVADLAGILDSDGRSIFGRTVGDGALAILARLLVIGMPVARAPAERALPRDLAGSLARLDVLTLDADRVVPHVRLLPCEDLVLASDLPLVRATGVRPDYVMGAGLSSLTLARLGVRRPASCALDLGTGSGVLAFLAARQSAAVVAVERNPRALGFAAFNAWLNGVANVAFVRGDFVGACRPASFDSVYCNPPYVIAPDHRYAFRDSTRNGDGLCESLVRAVPALLRPGGFAQILCHWAHVAGERWQDRLARWCEESGCDAWVLRFESFDPGHYATSWTAATEDADPARTAASVAAWLAYFARERIEGIGYGMITLRARATGAPWFRVQDAPSRVSGAAGDHVERAFAAYDFLDATRADDRLLAASLRPAPELRLEQTSEPGAGGWRLVGAKLRLARGLAYEGEIEPSVAELVARCNGARPLGTVLEEVTGGAAATRDEALAAALSAVRTLVARGFLVPPT